MKEFRTSQIIELKKLSKAIYDMADSALAYRNSLIDSCGTTEYEARKYHSLHDPETYYNFKLFDKGVSIIRLFNSREWFNDDPEKKKFHFAIRCYNFRPSINLKHSDYQSYIDFGDFEKIEDTIKYFISAIIQLTDCQFDIILPFFKQEVLL